MCEHYKGQMSMCSGLIFKNARLSTTNMTVTYNAEWATQAFVTSLTDIPIISMTFTCCNHIIQWNEGYVRVEGSKFRLTEHVMAGGAPEVIEHHRGTTVARRRVSDPRNSRAPRSLSTSFLRSEFSSFQLLETVLL
jgi:hypothetical protein